MNACIMASASLYLVIGVGRIACPLVCLFFVSVCVLSTYFYFLYFSYNCLNDQKLSFMIGLDRLGYIDRRGVLFCFF